MYTSKTVMLCFAITGIGINYAGTSLGNNTFITVDNNGLFADIHCSSGSTMVNVGSWISPTGIDLTSSILDPFDVTVGDGDDPGSLVIQQASGHLLTNSFQGVYTCIMPDENGVQNYLHLGIYKNGFNGMLSSHNPCI